MQGKVDLCGVNTSKLKVLKSEESIALLRRARQGDQAAREELIAGNLRLVLSVIQKFAGRGEHMDDLFQVGCIGLIKAIDNFNVDLDVKFSTYGVPMIIGEIRRFLRDNSTIRVSRSLRDTAYKVLQAKEAFQNEHQREPTLDELSKLLDLRREDIVTAMDAVMDPISLFEPIYSDSGDAVCVMDQVRDGKNTDEAWLDHIALSDAISDNFNVDLDVKFSTYGVPMIIGEIRRFLRDNSTIRVSRSLRDTAYKVLQAKEAFQNEHQREPTLDELSKLLDLRREDIVTAMDAVMDPISLFEPIYSDSGDAVCVMDQVRDGKNTDEAWLDHIALSDAISKLGQREQEILELRFFQGKTQMEVSAEIGISQAQVSRLEKHALKQIRKEF